MSGQTFKSDVWSLGCTVIELLTGHPPYWDVDPMRAMFCIVQDATPHIPDSLPQEVKDFLLRCFVKDPAQRASAEELLQTPWIENNAHLVSLAGAKLDYNSVVGTLSKVYGKKKSVKSTKSRKVSKKKMRNPDSPSSSDISPAPSADNLVSSETNAAKVMSDPLPAASAPPVESRSTHSEPATVSINLLSIGNVEPAPFVPQHEPAKPAAPIEEPQPPAPTSKEIPPQVEDHSHNDATTESKSSSSSASPVQPVVEQQAAPVSNLEHSNTSLRTLYVLGASLACVALLAGTAFVAISRRKK